AIGWGTTRWSAAPFSCRFGGHRSPAAPRLAVGHPRSLVRRVVGALIGMGALILCGLLAGCAAQQAPVVSRTPQAPTAVQAAPGDRVHVVVKGDTLYSIAWRYE